MKEIKQITENKHRKFNQFSLWLEYLQVRFRVNNVQVTVVIAFNKKFKLSFGNKIVLVIK